MRFIAILYCYTHLWMCGSWWR